MFDGNLPENRKSRLLNVGCETCETTLVFTAQVTEPRPLFLWRRDSLAPPFSIRSREIHARPTPADGEGGLGDSLVGIWNISTACMVTRKGV